MQMPDESEIRAFDAAAKDFDTFKVMLMVREALPVLMALQVVHQAPLEMDPEWRAFVRSAALMLETEITARHPELKEFLARGWTLGG